MTLDEWRKTQNRVATAAEMEKIINPPLVVARNLRPGGVTLYGARNLRPGGVTLYGAQVLNEPFERAGGGQAAGFRAGGGDCDMECQIANTPAIVERIERKWWHLW